MLPTKKGVRDERSAPHKPVFPAPRYSRNKKQQVGGKEGWVPSEEEMKPDEEVEAGQREGAGVEWRAEDATWGG